MLDMKPNEKREQSDVWKNRSFPYVPMNDRDPKPRTKSITEIRGPYYAVTPHTYTDELLRLMGEHVDGYKYAGGSFSLMPADEVIKLNRICHDHGVYVSTGGWIENVLARAPNHIDEYIEECKRLEFDMIELSTGFIQLPVPDLITLIQKVKKAGLKPKPERCGRQVHPQPIPARRNLIHPGIARCHHPDMPHRGIGVGVNRRQPLLVSHR